MGVRLRDSDLVLWYLGSDRGGLLRARQDVAALAQLIEPISGKLAPQHAEALVDRWLTLGRVIAANRECLCRDVPQGVADLICSARSVLEQALLSDLRDRPLLENGSVLERYLTLSLGHATVEQIRLLLLDARLQLLADEPLVSGTVSEVPLYTREVARRCMELGATGIILVHNHPSGTPNPGSDDLETTRRLAATLKELDIQLWDHIIVSARGTTSLRAQGKL